jgi:pimeloyl-ACP methyl ester carboxylesterase
MLDGRVDPDPFPGWMSEEDLDYFVAAFEQGGFRGPINRYRCMDRDWEDLSELAGAKIHQPSFFVAGSRDLVRRLIPGTDLYADPGTHCTDFRGKVIVEGKGHWIQQEAPREVTEGLLGFLGGL